MAPARPPAGRSPGNRRRRPTMLSVAEHVGSSGTRPARRPPPRQEGVGLLAIRHVEHDEQAGRPERVFQSASAASPSHGRTPRRSRRAAAGTPGSARPGPAPPRRRRGRCPSIDVGRRARRRGELRRVRRRRAGRGVSPHDFTTKASTASTARPTATATARGGGSCRRGRSVPSGARKSGPAGAAPPGVPPPRRRRRPQKSITSGTPSRR